VSLRRLELDTSWGPLTIAGGTRAGEGTLIVLPQLRLALDPGRPHRALPPMSTVFISHGHMDHLGGLGYWASQRFLNSMSRGRLLVPEAIAGDIDLLLGLHASLEGGRPYQVEIVPVEDGSIFQLRADMQIEAFRTDHWVPTLGAELISSKRRLKPELTGLPPEEISQRRQDGEEVSITQKVRLLSYCADTGPKIFEWRPRLVRTEVLMIECSFFRTDDRERAQQFGHLHLEDLLAVATDLECRHLVVLHPSRRNRLREIEAVLDADLRPLLSGKLHHLMVDWD
jgi:ribonuclease Z